MLAACTCTYIYIIWYNSLIILHLDIGGPSVEKNKEKPMYLKDYERKRLLERGR